MTHDRVEVGCLDSHETVGLAELSHCCGLSEAELDELVAYCALVPLVSPSHEPSFSVQWVAPLRNAAKLRLDFDLDLFTVALLLDHLFRIEMLERQLFALQALLPSQRPPA